MYKRVYKKMRFERVYERMKRYPRRGCVDPYLWSSPPLCCCNVNANCARMASILIGVTVVGPPC